MSKTIEVYLDAWAVVKRRERQMLQRPAVAQNRYDINAGGVSVWQDVDEDVIVPADCGRGYRVSMSEVDLTCRIVAALDDQYSEVLKARYLLDAPKEKRAAIVGVSTATFDRRLRDAKHAFGAVWYGIRNKVTQRGVMMKVEEYEESC